MFQTVVMLLASPQGAARSEAQDCRPASRMATLNRPAGSPGQNAAPDEAQKEGPLTWLTVVGNALGFSLLMTGLWLVVRLAEILLG